MHHIICVAICCYTHYCALPSDICITILCCQLLYTSHCLCCHLLLYTLFCVAICFIRYTPFGNHLLYAYHFLCFRLLLHIMLRYHLICASHSFASLSFVWIAVVLSVVTIWYTRHTLLCFRLLCASQCFVLLSVICYTLLVLLSVTHLTLCSLEDSHQCRSETCSGRSRWFPDWTSRTCRCQGRLYIH